MDAVGGASRLASLLTALVCIVPGKRLPTAEVHMLLASIVTPAVIGRGLLGDEITLGRRR